MYYTYVVRPGDAPEGKGPEFQPFWGGMMQHNLRGGLLLQLTGYAVIMISCIVGGNGIQISRAIGGDSDYLKSAPIIILFIGTFFFTAGAVCLQNFRNIADDDARQDKKVNDTN